MEILDQHGRPYETPKPEMQEFATARKDIDIFTGWLTRLENPDPVLRTESAGAGLRLYDDVKRDAHAGSVLQTRYLSVVGKEWQIEAADGPATRGRTPQVTREQKIADFVQKVLLDCNFDQARQELLQGILYGFYAAEVLWKQTKVGGEPSIVVDKIRAKHPKRFTFSQERELRLLTPTSRFDGEPVPDRKFIVFTWGSSDNPYGEGLGQKLWWPVWFKKNNIKFWLVFLEKFGSPTAVGKHPRGAKPEEKETLLNALDAIQQETGIAIPDDLAIEFLEATRGGSVSYETMCEYMDKQVSKAVLGQVATTEGTPGRLGNEDAQEEVRADILKADADLQCECLNSTIIKWIVDFNFPGVVDYPHMWIRTDAEQDLKDLAERDKTLAVDIGVPVPKTYWYRTYGIPEPTEEDEALVVPQKPASSGGMFAERGRFTPDQQELEELAEDSVSDASQDMSGVDAEIRKLIEGVESLEELKDRILELYEGMDTKDLQKTLAEALGTAALYGLSADTSLSGRA
ncbi:MAG: DUF935 family protein [Desulfobacteraceae bacterium]|jgi:phage gp29-like protein